MEKRAKEKMIETHSSILPVLNAHAAGIDIGSTEHCVAFHNGKDGYEVMTTQSFTSDLDAIVVYLQNNGITTAAMESTGVYWVPLYLKLEEAGIEVYLVNAKHVKNVRGRKKDDTDAIWIAKLHACGLLTKSFQPDNDIRALRELVRHRRSKLDTSSDCVRRMQKSLELMNIKIHTVISDLLGKTGMKMLHAIVSGERDPHVLATLCDPRIKASQEDILKSLEGIWKKEYLKILSQNLAEYEFLQHQVKECEKDIEEELLRQTAKLKEGDLTDVKQDDLEVIHKVVVPDNTQLVIKVKKMAKAKKNQFDTPMNKYLMAMTGVDLTKIPGVSDITALELISEIGLDMSKWDTSKRFAAWLNVIPNTKISGGKILSSKLMQKKNKANQVLRQAASSLSNNKSPLGDYYRRMRSRLGKRGAVLATAHKLSRIIFKMLSEKKEFDMSMIIDSQQKSNEKKIKALEKKIEKLKKAG
jgi:transposase